VYGGDNQSYFPVKIYPEIEIGKLMFLLCYMKVYGLLRHGARYPTLKHLLRWNSLHQSLKEKLSLDSTEEGNNDENRAAKLLQQWTNPLYQDVVEGRAQPSDLTQSGMREQFCLGRRLRERFPVILKHDYSPLVYDFRSSEKSRAVKR